LVYWLVTGLVIEWIKPDRNSALAKVLILLVVLITPIWFVTYVVLFFRVVLWRCPECTRYFCCAWWCSLPGTQKCVHCGFHVPVNQAAANAPDGRGHHAGIP
jgi:hypothetical protein